MKKLLTLALTLLLCLCLLAPTAAFAAEETITQEEANALYEKLVDLYCRVNNPNKMMDRNAEPLWVEKVPYPVGSYPVGAEKEDQEVPWHPLKEAYNTPEKMTAFAEKTLVHSLAVKVLSMCDFPNRYIVRDGIICTDGKGWAPSFFGFYNVDASVKPCTVLSGDSTTAVLQILVDDYDREYNENLDHLDQRYTLECVKTDAGWRISGGELIERMYGMDIPKTADSANPTSVVLWVSFAVLSLAAITVALYERKRVME